MKEDAKRKLNVSTYKEKNLTHYQRLGLTDKSLKLGGKPFKKNFGSKNSKKLYRYGKECSPKKLQQKGGPPPFFL